jgi:hypothetical protein
MSIAKYKAWGCMCITPTFERLRHEDYFLGQTRLHRESLPQNKTKQNPKNYKGLSRKGEFMESENRFVGCLGLE